MLPAVGFDDQSPLLTDEVGYVGTDGLLSSELGAIELTVSKDGP